MQMSVKIVAVCGPTASGKSSYALDYCKDIAAEIVCMDAFQVYKNMRILSAGPSDADKRCIPHHLYEFLSPLDSFSAADFYKRAVEVIKEILSRGNTPVLVGGTGLYLRLLQNGLELPLEEPDFKLREELKQEHLERGNLFMHEKLAVLNPKRASQLHPNDVKRVIRALEIELGPPVTIQKVDLLGDLCVEWEKLCILGPRDDIYNKIERRIDSMIFQGLEAEVEHLLSLGVSPSHTSWQALGLKETALYLQGECSRDEWMFLFKRNTRRFAKKQLTWLRSEKGLKFPLGYGELL
jgi:tRNA dimethylallyltransferase